jgi:hypothetical protein
MGLAIFGLASEVAEARPAPAPPEIRDFLEAASSDERTARSALDRLAASWRDGYAPMLLDLARFMRSDRPETGGPAEDSPGLDDGDSRGGVPNRGGFPGAEGQGPRTVSGRIRERLVRFVEKQTSQRFGHDLKRWRNWYWNRPYDPHPDYAAFKAGLYGQVDRRMAAFFPPGARELIRLDEVDWGGVGVNGIPPLVHPKVLPATGATFLKDSHVVFGLFLNGEARAYPKRILAWHEMARDRVGGVELALVYCTLCGTVIPYGAEVGGQTRTFGTSGLLYRSNKLMFDEESMSLWSTVEGKPVLGALAGQPLVLVAYPVVTTTWKEWREAHPRTTVVSLDTGVKRDYAEGAAYRDYFATDALMFAVPKVDTRLKNKDEVLALVVSPAAGSGPAQPVALSAAFLAKNPLHHLEAAGRRLVVVTSPGGANRVYDASKAVPPPRRLRPDGLLEAETGTVYRLTEDALVPEGASAPFAGEARPLPRVPARRAFWFGWVAQYPETLLTK